MKQNVAHTQKTSTKSQVQSAVYGRRDAECTGSFPQVRLHTLPIGMCGV